MAKRSEVLLEIAKELHKQGVELDKENGTYNVDLDFKKFKDSWIEDADDILSMLEVLGMLPPSIPTNATGWEVGKGTPSYINQWESEDA